MKYLKYIYIYIYSDKLTNVATLKNVETVVPTRSVFTTLSNIYEGAHL